jgi:outer membrane protein, multidrug efflux system
LSGRLSLKTHRGAERPAQIRKVFCSFRVGLLALWLASVMATGCKVGPKYVRPAVDQPASFKSEPTDKAAPRIALGWWQLYNDSELDRLITSAHASNQALKQAVAAVDQARALTRVARSFLFPSIALNPDFLRQRFSGSRDSSITGQVVPRSTMINDWLIPIDLSYEIDVWGRVRRSLESARAQAAVSTDDLALVQLTVETDVAQDYYTLRSLDAQIQILTQTVEAYREQVRLLSAQLKNGLVSPIVLSQAQTQLDSTVAQLEDTRRARADQEHALAILCGSPAPAFAVEPVPTYEPSAPVVPPGLPAQLLVRRPDVAAAEQSVVAANAQIGAATAELYPTFSLTSFAGYESADPSKLFNWQSSIASIQPTFTLPIFEGGRLKANVEAAKAVYRQTVAAYVNQVLVAYADAEDALTDLHALSDEIVSLRAAVSASQEYLRLARVQYENGLVDYLIVIDAERTLLANQLLLAQTLNLQMGASIHLIKALGGGWENPP